MTLIIALNCKDGIVMASDGQATGYSAGGPIRHEVKKIFKIGENVIFGASGSIGTIQKSLEIIQAFSKDLSGGLTFNLKDRIRQKLFPLMKNELERHKTFHGEPDGAPIADILLCVLNQDGSCKIWHIAPDCSDELLDDIGYGCTGNGDVFAYTILKIFYVKDLDIERGKLIAYRVIKEAIEIGAYGLGGPIDIWSLDKKGQIKNATPEEIMALHDSYLSWKEAESELFKTLVKK
jgi:20S proteasome alpha/beta subunit